MTNFKVIGIDPAPSKKSTIFDGERFHEMNNIELKSFLSKLSEQKEEVLICWDAPLSFNTNNTNFYTRAIESYFQKHESLPKKGISIRGFAGCPHWAITQYLLGYPRIDEFERGFVPNFKLVSDVKDLKDANKYVTEVHPALAIWVWLKDRIDVENIDWQYKKNNQTFTPIKQLLQSSLKIDQKICDQIKNDDYLDAYVAWKLGRVWIDGKGKTVRILGNSRLGSFLLPYNETLFNGFNAMMEK